jgi:hypothetical protein
VDEEYMSPIKIAAKEQVVTNQRTLLLMMGAIFTAGCIWVDLKHTLSDHGKAIDALAAGQAAAVLTVQADHEIILHMSDQLRWAVRDQANHEHNPDGGMPKN